MCREGRIQTALVFPVLLLHAGDTPREALQQKWVGLVWFLKNV